MEPQPLPDWQDQEMMPLVSRPLGILTLVMEDPAVILDTPHGNRKVVRVTGGSLIGPRLRAEVLPGGGDWTLFRGDGVLTLDVRLTLRSHDGAMIYMTYIGLRYAVPEAAARLARNEPVAAAEMYFRTSPVFETGDDRYSWLSRRLFIGVGERLRFGPRYHIHEIL